MPASMPAVQARPCVPKQLVWLLSIPLVTFVHAAASQCTHGTDPLTSGSLTVSKFNAGAVGTLFTTKVLSGHSFRVQPMGRPSLSIHLWIAVVT